MSEHTKLIEATGLYPLIDFEKNNENGIDLSRLSFNSSKAIYWKCSNGHTFKEKVNVVNRRKNKCFYCSGRLIWPGDNDLQTLYPEIAKEFDTDKNGITPDHISPRDTKSYWWACANDHPSFLQSVTHRVNRKTKCPYCTGRKVLSGENDLETLYPEIAVEWDLDKNEGVQPKDVSAFSYNSYWWICPKGHSYKKKVIKRTKFHKPVDCPKCIKAHSTSFPEQAIYYYTKKCFPDAINRYKEPFEKGMELDIYVPSYRLGIEYDGLAFHNDEDQHQRERRKYLACQQLGIKLARVKESEDTWTDTADIIFYASKRMKDEALSAFLHFMFSNVFSLSKYTFNDTDKRKAYLNRHLGFPTDFNISRDRPEILEYLVDVERSFGSLHPEQAAIWCTEANGKLTPFMFTSGSNYPAVWKCPKCGDTWTATISNIVKWKVKSCPKCSMKANGKTITRAKTQKYGSLAERSEILLRQWDFEGNGDLSPYEIPLNYSSPVAWKCDKCGYKWTSSPNSRVRKDRISGCPHCTGKVAMPGVDDLETLYPDVAKEWDYEKNAGVLPSQIRSHANEKYYWICPACGNSYSAYPGNRVNGHGCRECANVRIGIKNSKLVGQFDDSGKLIATYHGLSRAASAVGVVPNAIYQAVKSGKKSKGYYWRYLSEEGDSIID